jgi:hypothetical protein
MHARVFFAVECFRYSVINKQCLRNYKYALYIGMVGFLIKIKVLNALKKT